jgi:hypothetical protein
MHLLQKASQQIQVRGSTVNLSKTVRVFLLRPLAIPYVSRVCRSRERHTRILLKTTKLS